jgi:hypothetical protein
MISPWFNVADDAEATNVMVELDAQPVVSEPVKVAVFVANVLAAYDPNVCEATF